MTIEARPPVRTIAQRDAALEKANRIRIAQAKLKRNLKTASRPEAWAQIIDELEQPSEVVARMYVIDLLKSCHRIGDTKAHRLLRLADVSPRRRVGGLSDRQRTNLADQLRRVRMIGGFG